DRPERAGRGVERNREVLDFKQSHRSAPLQFRVKRIAQTVANQVDGENSNQDSKAGESNDPPGTQDELTRFGKHRAPFWRWRLRAHAKKAQSRNVEDGVGERHR